MGMIPSKSARRSFMALAGLACTTAAFIQADSIRHIFNEHSQGGVSPEKRHVITTEGSNCLDYGVLVSARHVLSTGHVPIYATFSPGNLFIGNISVNWDKDDAFIRALKNVEDQTAQSIEEHFYCRHLIGKEQWEVQDIALWNELVSFFINDHMSAVPGLDKYRSEGDEKRPATGARHLNDLASDIENGTYEKEFDCEAMSLVKIVLLQKMADRFLGVDQAPGYFYVSGKAIINPDNTISNHAYIICHRQGQITGVIEGTRTYGDAFSALATPCSLSAFTAGRPLVTRWGQVYGTDFTKAQAEAAREDAGITFYSHILENLKDLYGLVPGQKTYSF